FNGVSTGGTIDYQFELNTPASNTAGTPDNFIEQIQVSIEDEGGETTGGTLLVNIIDDAPDAVDDSATVAITGPDSGTATGNVISDVSGEDTPGADGGITVTGIGSVNVPGSTPGGTGTLTIQGEYGTLVIQADGSYTYTRDAGSPGGVSDIFEYTI